MVGLYSGPKTEVPTEFNSTSPLAPACWDLSTLFRLPNFGNRILQQQDIQKKLLSTGVWRGGTTHSKLPPELVKDFTRIMLENYGLALAEAEAEDALLSLIAVFELLAGRGSTPLL